ncbi:unannotated protein [freshwater metagenome]|uniref:Unannotated protein n=1 Tax=freshwater metagenome TaxID=449393 RepID=A0A6J7FK39_9ZZZZ|nr:hypothetical protein [Actinomycetota bacterium]
MQIHNPYPWYDSNWLAKYTYARQLIEREYPDVLSGFIDAFEPLRTRPDFEVVQFERVFDDRAMRGIEMVIDNLRAAELETHETLDFRRFIVHDHPEITELQATLVDLVSEGAGEPVEPAYNFLSLYSPGGVCEVHLDTPRAKWTLDLCVRQSQPWPIYFSQVVPWPESGEGEGEGWQHAIRSSPRHQFRAFSMEPANAILFSGSSQWHYRDRLPANLGHSFCELVFFHFIPVGMDELLRPRNWARLFGIAELDVLAER